MGTHCYIGIEENEGVEYIYIHFDGDFSSIVPTLREYTNRDDVRKMIARGDEGLISLSELQKNKPYNVLRENRPKHISSMYSLLDACPRVAYVYVFTLDNEWVCTSVLPYFSMSELKYYNKNYTSDDDR